MRNKHHVAIDVHIPLHMHDLKKQNSLEGYVMEHINTFSTGMSIPILLRALYTND